MEPESEERRGVTVPLPTDAEFCVVVPYEEPRCSATIRLLPGVGMVDPRVDVCGSPLVVDVSYQLLPGSVVHVFAWSNASVRVEGSDVLLKNVFRSPARSIVRPIVEYHCSLHALRVEAEKVQGVGPTTVVCGSSTSGKAMVARSLCSYAARAGWKPLLVDLDCGVAQSVTIPGAIAAAVIDYPISVDQVLSQTALSLAYFVGNVEAQKTVRGEATMYAPYAHYTQLLMSGVRERLMYHAGDQYAASGAIVLLPELKDNSGVNFVIDLSQRYGVTNVLCIGDDYLFHKLLAHFTAPQALMNSVKTTVGRMSQSFCSVPRPRIEFLLPLRYREYFLGSGAVNLHPSQWSKPFNSLEILLLKDDGDQAVLTAVEQDALQGIVGCVGALFPTAKTTSALQNAPSVFVRVQSVDPSGINFLTTTHHTFPSERLTLVVGSARWITS